MDKSLFLSLFPKIVGKAISSYIDYTVWVGHFVHTSELNLIVCEGHSIIVAKNTYKKSILKLLENIEYELSILKYNSTQIKLFLDAFVEEIKESNPFIYLLYSTSCLKIRVEELENEIDKIRDNYSHLISKYESFYTIDDIDNYLKESSNNNLFGLKFFDFNDNDFANKLGLLLTEKDKKILRISGNYAEETLYATLVELKKIFSDNYVEKVYIFDSLSCLKKTVVSLPSDSIIVFDTHLTDEDIPVFTDFINIHIVSKDENADYSIRNRLRSSTEQSFRDAGFSNDDINNVLGKCGNNYPLYKTHIFNMTSKYVTNIKRNISHRNLAYSLLFPIWNINNLKDKSLIETFVGKSIDNYINEITPNSLLETPFAKIVNGQSNGPLLKVISYNDENIFCDLERTLTNNDIDLFFKYAIKILLELPYKYLKSYNPFKINTDFFSDEIRKSVLHTLTFLSIYKRDDFVEKKIISLSKKFLKEIDKKNNINYYHYLCSLLPELIEICPSVFYKYAQNSINNKLGIYNVIQDEKNKQRIFDMPEDFYSVLFSFRKLLFLEKFKRKAFLDIFKMISICSNNEQKKACKEVIVSCLLAWINIIPLDFKEKKAYLKSLFVLDRSNAFDICKDLQYKKTVTVVHYNGPKYLQYESFSQSVNNRECFGLLTFYSTVLIKMAVNPKDFADIIEDSVFRFFSSPEQAKKIIDLIVEKINSFEDDIAEKEVICDQIRRFINRNRRFKKEKWVANERFVKIYEKALKKVVYKVPETKYVHLFCGEREFVLKPTTYDKDNYDYYEEKRVVGKYIAARSRNFLKENLNVDILLDLLNKKNSTGNSNAPSEYFVKFYFNCKKNDISDAQKLYFDLIKKVNLKSACVSYIAWTLENRNRKSFFNLAKRLSMENETDKLLVFLSRYKIDYEDKVYVNFILNEMTFNQRELYFKSLPGYVPFEKNKKTLNFILSNIQNLRFQKGEKNHYIEFLYYFNLSKKDENSSLFVLNKLSRIKFSIIENTYDLGELSDLVCDIQQTFLKTNDIRIISKIAKLEMILGFDNDYKKPLFLYNYLSVYPHEYMSFVNRAYFPTKNNREKNLAHIYFFVEYKLKFCPGEVKGVFDELIFNSWSNFFIQKMSEIHPSTQDVQKIYRIFGKLCGNSLPDVDDGISPHKAIRKFIEGIPTKFFESFKSGYLFTTYNNIGIRTITDGSDLIAKSKQLMKEAKFLEDAKYIKTADILKAMSKNFEEYGIRERADAEE